ncbi:unnamed protein product [Paramecium sonneborni]|uniref:Uncharacterized protein n=1 Tax=Paramecium sonneborni TaxID=65129 RepID=A0A8S1P7C5_9CILI|nr:unnamed protein product [Paramecium sonneborni]
MNQQLVSVLEKQTERKRQVQERKQDQREFWFEVPIIEKQYNGNFVKSNEKQNYLYLD